MSEFKSVLIEDNLTGLLTSEISFGVESAGKANYQQFNATSISNNAMAFNCQVPNQSCVIDRHLLFSSTVNFTLKYTGVPPPAAQAPAGPENIAFQYGLSSAFGPYPLNSLMTTVSSTINNVSVNSNTQDILACLLRLNDNALISEQNSNTSCLPDFFYNKYSDGVLATNNPLGGLSQSSYDAVYFGRGSLPLRVLKVTHTVLGAGGNPNVVNTSLVSTALTDTWVIECSIDLIEPFIALSPFTNNAKNQEAGFYGINQISMNINIDSTMKRFWRESRSTVLPNATNSSPSYLTSISLGNSMNPNAFEKASLLMRFVTMTPSQVRRLGSSRNCVPYMEFPRYLSIFSQNGSINAVPVPTLVNGAITQPVPFKAQLTSSNIQLSVVPDRIIIGVRIPMAEQNATNSDSWLPIKKCLILFNSNSGILSSATVTDLYKLSRRNGSSQNFFEWNGVGANIATAVAPYDDTGGVQPIYTTGSLLVLDPVRDFSLDDWLSASSSGAFNFQVQLDVENTYSFPVKPEIIIITQQSGIFSTTEGVSATEVGILTKEVVLSTRMNEKPESMMMESEFDRLVGGKRHTNGVFNNMANRMHSKYNTGYNGSAHRGMSGSAMSGGVVSGGVMSGGRLGKYIR
jgi:hypothetical protein